MYYTDCVIVRLNGGLSSPLWFTRRVKQGCVLSPLLFSFYISGLGLVLHSMKEVVNFEGTVISDLVLISRTCFRGIKLLLLAVQRFCCMRVKLAVWKTVILSSGPDNTTWKITDTSIQTWSFSSCKKPWVWTKYTRKKYDQVSRTGYDKNYAHTIFRCTKLGLDKGATAQRLWECCANPSILYASESMVISRKTINELDKIQHSVAMFILQLTASSARLVGYIDAGFMPMNLRLMIKSGLSYMTFITKRKIPSSRIFFSQLWTILKTNGL